MPEADPQWELVRRVLDSATFQRARQARAFLLHVCERTLAPQPSAPEFDGQTSGIVRAQASQVRKKLQQYFATEGAGEPVVIDLSLGSYVPVFRGREPRDAELPARAAAPLPWIAVGICALLLAATAWIVLKRRPEPYALASAGPQVARLWQQLFDNDRPTTVLLSDANITQLQDLLHEPIPVADYDRERLNAHVERIADPAARHMVSRSLDRQYTTMADVTMAGRVLLLHAAQGLTADVILARDANAAVFRDHNVILVGPRRANPWIDLFEPRLNFKSRFDENTRVSSFVNTAPLPGERDLYSVQWTVRGFCRVAYLPGREGQGTALLVSGTDMTSTEMGADFITSEHWIRDLRERLGLADAAPLPFFEVLLESKVVLHRTSAPALIAHRVIQGP